ncbi:hypothetical protein HMPREF1531_00603 [Propionibacterium sp. oral taxon 192 str. F0372]|nr:hypothetical protein HMPREF1531_00603 [Propionibacterium sp. oral taxon 192 str. F0372]
MTSRHVGITHAHNHSTHDDEPIRDEASGDLVTMGDIDIEPTTTSPSGMRHQESGAVGV